MLRPGEIECYKDTQVLNRVNIQERNTLYVVYERLLQAEMLVCGKASLYNIWLAGGIESCSLSMQILKIYHIEQ